MKRYIKDFNEDEKMLLLENNRPLQEKIEQQLYNDDIEYQEELFDYIFGKRNNKIDIKDNYNSFYLKVLDYRIINDIDTGYLSDNNIKLYNKAKEELEKLDNIENWYSDEWYDQEEIVNEKAKELVEDIEKQLHDYEKGYYYNNEKDKEYIKECFNDFIYDNTFSDTEYYIIDDKYDEIYIDTTLMNIF